MGRCNGSNGKSCVFPDSTTICTAGTCANGKATTASVCNGSGDCTTATTTPCTSNLCGADGKCSGSCTATSCIAGTYCDSTGTCSKTLDLGAGCSSAAQCTSGSCVDGVCCDGKCDGQCQSCKATGSVGRCKTIQGDPVSPRAACGGTGKCKATCDGTKATSCVFPDSETVCAAASCTAGKLTTASVCNSLGSCTASSTTPCINQCASDGSAKCADACTATSCGAGLYCNSGTCTPTIDDGKACTGDAQCTHGHCVSGICCATTCSAACYTCSTGTCLPTTTGVGCGRSEGPCDIYATNSTPCVAAYSMVRALLKNYSGPLYQVRNNSSAANMGSGGATKDIGSAADGFADTTTQDAFCANTICTVSVLYDQSGNGNHLTVAKKGSSGEAFAGTDDFESSATKGTITVGGRTVYSLYMSAREGYRLAAVGKNMPLGTTPQGIYEIVDGTHVGTFCCWDFGNVPTDPMEFEGVNALFFGKAFWGQGAGTGPWFMADFESGIWAGGSVVGDNGWGAIGDTYPPNANNPTMKVPFAMGILKTTGSTYSLRMADIATATGLQTAYNGSLPKQMANQGGIVLGVGGQNANDSWGTFYEGAITSGAPSADTDLAVFKNVKAVGYSK